MKRLCVALAVLGLAAGIAGAADDVEVRDLSLEGEIDGENIVFTLTFSADAERRGVSIPVVVGDVAYLGGDLPRGVELLREDDRYVLRFDTTWERSITFRFASRAEKDAEWRQTRFSIPMASVRRLAVLCDRDDLDVRFPGALNVEREKTEDGQLVATAFLGVSDAFEVRWKPQLRKLEAELVVACDANVIGTASVGALRLDTVFTYRIIQGTLDRLDVEVPDINVTQVRGEDIQDWRIERPSGDPPRLVVQLSRPQESTYRLQIEGERVLPEFPTQFDLPVLVPRGVIRSSGFVAVGTDSAIKLGVSKLAGVTQVDPEVFPSVTLTGGKGQRAIPSRNTAVYQFASVPYTVAIDADDIVTSFTADSRLAFTLQDNELLLSASIELDVKDAPAREITIETDADPTWTVTGITGVKVSEPDTDVREEDGKRLIVVPFKQGVTGATLVEVRMEKMLGPDQNTYASPSFHVHGAKSERGYIVLAAEKGVRLNLEKMAGLREVHTGSAPMRIAGAQHAFRFREPGWSLVVGVERTQASVHAEVFHLVSLGEGVLYSSATITYHIGGAPVQEFRVRVPEAIEVIEFTGADIEGWTRDGDLCTVRLQTRTLGDYTLLVTYDRQFDYAGEEIAVGGIETVGTESEVGFIALATSANLKITGPDELPSSIIKIEPDEIPAAYAAPVADPIAQEALYKYVKTPHTVIVKVEPLETEQLLDQVADYIRLTTAISADGESVTTADYYIKNSSRQYLVVKLPRGVELWSIRQVDADGHKEDVLSQESDQGILIPVSRPRDPNTPIHLELMFAQSHGELGFWRSGVGRLGLKAPVLPDTNGTFAGWKVTLPEGFTLAGAAGNMTPEQPVYPRGLRGAVRKAWRIGLALIDGPGRRTVRRALGYDWGGGRTEDFTRTVNLAGADPLALKLHIVPAWMGSGGDARLMIGLLGISVLVAGAGRIRRRTVVSALGLTLCVAGLAQSSLGRSVLAIFTVLVVIVWVARWLVRGGAALLWHGLCRVGRGVSTAARTCARPLARALATHRAKRAARRTPRQGPAAVSASSDPPPFEPDPPQDEPGDRSGHVRVATLGILAAVGLLSGLVLAEQEPLVESPAAPEAPALVVDSVEITARGPTFDRDSERSAAVSMIIRFETDDATTFPALPAGSVLTGYDLSSRHLDLQGSEHGHAVVADDGGSYRVRLDCRVPVETLPDGTLKLALPLPKSLENCIRLTLPETGLDVQSEGSVLLRSSESDTDTEVYAVFGPVETADITWGPRVRKTRLEESVYYCEVNTLVTLQSGVVDLDHVVRHLVAQGEVQELRLLVPDGMTVTAVDAPHLATWSFDPATRLLEALLEQPMAGDFVLRVVTQISSEGIPYSVPVGALRVQGAKRQRGAVALTAPDDIQVRVADARGLHAMNIEDFALHDFRDKNRAAGDLRRAFRYHEPEDVFATLQTERVVPEIRVEETGTLSIADERTVLATKLDLSVARAGVFGVVLSVPADYEVETLSGRDVSHWDEQRPGGEEKGSRLRQGYGGQAGDSGGEGTTNGLSRIVEVHFSRQVTDATEINVVVARVAKGIEEHITVPRVVVRDARKHHGKLTVSAERGVRVMIDDHRGVDIKKASEEGISQPGVLVFDILRPNWSLALRTEVMDPVIKPEVLQWVDLTEGMLQCRAYVQYKIENAGVKSLRLKSPDPKIRLSISGRNIARVLEVDDAEGIWRVDLHSKVENRFGLTVSYPVAYETKERHVRILPLQTVDTDPQRGYLVITCEGRVQVEPTGSLAGLKVEDPRNIPPMFEAGDLSSAIQCYRTVRPDFALDLSVVRHESASVLPASIERVRMTSVVSSERKLLTRVSMQMSVGDLRLLPVQLPRVDDRLWTVLVNGREVATSRKGDTYSIPLEEESGDGAGTSVDFIYASASLSGLGLTQKYEAPKFGLPLSDVEWDLYVRPNLTYYGLGGTLDPREAVRDRQRFDARSYEEWNRAQREAQIEKAQRVLDVGAKLVRSGQQQRAKKAFQQALNYSQAQEDLNEDARVQLRNVMKQQVKVGLVNRRDAVRLSRNIVDEEQLGQMEGFRDGDYTPEYASQVESRLSEQDNDWLEIVADKIIDQQAAAAGVVNAISITMPEHGRKLAFYRPLQIDPKGDLFVTFRAGSGAVGRLWNGLWPATLVFGVMLTALRRR